MKETKHAVPAEGAARKRLYYILIAACALVLATAVTLTAVFLTRGDSSQLENPGIDNEDPDDDPDDDPDEPDEPSGTELVFALPVEGTVSTGYTFWYNSTLNRYCLHTGIDFNAEAGTEVCAAAAGTVIEISDTLLEGGKVVIDHGNGLTSEYASVDVASSLKEGDTVAKGDVIGSVSASADVMGNEYDVGSHLHFAMYEEGASVDPSAYLDMDEK